MNTLHAVFLKWNMFSCIVARLSNSNTLSRVFNPDRRDLEACKLELDVITAHACDILA